MKKIILFAIILTEIAVAFAQTPNYQGIVYVTPTGAGTHSGDSWANATSALDTAQALAQANNCVVWVAAGVYYGDNLYYGDDIDPITVNAFTMVDGVDVYGGFAGTEPADFDLSLRDFEANETILDGDSARRVLYQPSNFNDTTIWDGFTIRNGYGFISEDESWLISGGGVILGTNGGLKQCKVINNTAGASAGVYAHNSIISNCQISNNFTRDIFFMGDCVSETYNSAITNCNISNNNGSGMYVYNSTITNCQIDHNTGAGVTAIHSYITNCHINDNGAAGGGTDSSVISNCQIHNNEYGIGASNSSVIINCQIYSQTSSEDAAVGVSNNSIISSCQIYDNAGGGVTASDFSTVSDCEIHNNTGFASGGVSARNSNVLRCNIHHNTNTLHYGGAIYAAGTSVSNCLIYNNTGGYGIFSGSDDAISNSTIAHNEGYGINAGFITNCIIWGNSLRDIAGGCDNTHCTYSAIEGGYPGVGNIPLIANTLYNPLFVNPSHTAGAEDTTANVDWHLQNGSMCINRGSNDAVFDSVDLDGTARIKRDTVDMGCYESDYYCENIPNNYHGIVYVTPNGAGTRSGDSWENALSSIDDAQAIALLFNADVWVSSGTYYGDTVNDNAFTMKGVNVYGSFLGNEPVDFDLLQRDVEANATILDGQQVQRVLYQPYCFNEEKIWDGFTIQHGNSSSGSGVFLSQYGRLNNCILRYNVANVGTCYANNSTISHCRIHNNTGEGIRASSNTIVYGSLIYNNSGSNVVMQNSSVIGSTIVCSDGYGVYMTNSIITNSIVWGNKRNGSPSNITGNGNAICSYSAIEGGYEGDGNITLNAANLPLFVNPSLTAGADDTTANVDWHLQNGSVCINRGSNDAGIDSLDLDGTARIKQDTVDMGCYESDYYSSPINCISFGDTTATACGSYSWHGYENLIESGDYMDTLVNVAGCDSIVTLHLTVNLGTHNVTDTTLCNGESFTWHDSTYTESGTYTYDYLNETDCPSTDTLHLTVNHGTHNVTDTTLCNGESFTWHDSTYTESGTYTYDYLNETDCPSTDTLHLTVETCDTTGLIHYDDNDITLYPNPTTGVVNVQYSMNNAQTNVVEIQVFDVYGRILDVVETFHETSLQIDLSHYANGIYVIKLVNGNRTIAMGKVVKQ